MCLVFDGAFDASKVHVRWYVCQLLNVSSALEVQENLVIGINDKVGPIAINVDMKP
jgi:hypothetical protein